MAWSCLSAWVAAKGLRHTILIAWFFPEWRLRIGLPDRTLGVAVRQRAIPATTSYALWDIVMIGAAVHDGRPCRGSLSGESIQPAYAFLPYSEDSGIRPKRNGEQSKLSQSYTKFQLALMISVLHATLKSWAETYRDGVNGKEQIVVQYALTSPSASTVQDDTVGSSGR